MTFRKPSPKNQARYVKEHRERMTERSKQIREELAKRAANEDDPNGF